MTTKPTQSVESLVVKIPGTFLLQSTKMRLSARLQGQGGPKEGKVVNRQNEKTPQKAAHGRGVRFGGRLMIMYANVVFESDLECEFNRLIF
jgi:hypothetical protein